MVLRRYKRLEVSETDQGLADKNLLAGIAAERMQPIVAFGTKHPNNRIGMTVRGGGDCGAAAAECAVPGGRHRWWRARGNL